MLTIKIEMVGRGLKPNSIFLNPPLLPSILASKMWAEITTRHLTPAQRHV